MNDIIIERGLEYGVQAPVFYGNLREQTGENICPRIPTGNLFLLLQTSPKISGNLREFPGECDLGILHSSSLLSMAFTTDLCTSDFKTQVARDVACGISVMLGDPAPR